MRDMVDDLHQVESALVDVESRPSHWRAAADEVTAYDRTPTAMRLPGAFGSVGQKPLVVISHGIPFTGELARNEVGWSEGQARLTALSTDSVHLIATKNSHTIAQQNPPLVAAAINIVVQALRKHSGIDRTAVAKLANPSMNAAILK